MQTTQFNFRTTKEKLCLFKQFCSKIGVTLSEFIDNTLLEKISQDSSTDKQTKKISERMLRELRLENTKEENKEKMRRRYLVKNTLRRLYLTTKASLINSRGNFINVEQNRAIINDAKKEFAEYLPEEKKRMKSEMQELENWNSREYAYEQMKLIDIIERGIPFIQKKLEIIERKKEEENKDIPKGCKVLSDGSLFREVDE